MASRLCLASSPCNLTRVFPKMASYRTPSNPTCLSLQVRSTMGAQTSVTPPPRRSANYPPSLWNNDFIQSLKNDYKEDTYTRQIEELKEDVRNLIDEEKGVVDQLELVDTLRQLGVAYHFEKEIKDVLSSISMSLEDINMVVKEDLYASALLFRLLREHGFEVSQDVFDSFKDESGSFKAYLCNDTRGMLSLYEASYLGFEGEKALDEASAFTSKHLKDFKGDIDPFLREQVAHALELPLNWRMPRVHTRWFIDAYERKDNMNPMLLDSAKLDFNMVQSIHQQDLRKMSRWWTDLGLGEKLDFARDRLMENFLWTIGVIFEPKFGLCRQKLTQINCLITTIDDVYDVYGSLDELELFTDAVNRWDANAIEQLPEYMQICFLALFNTTNATAYEIMKEKGLNTIPYLQKASYLVEAKWYHKGYTPTLDEYLDNAWISISGPVILVHAYVVLKKDLTEEALQYLDNYSHTICLSSMILRLADDLGTSSAEIERGDVPKSIQCYMREEGVSEAVAREHVRGLISAYWKKMNKDRMGSSPDQNNFISSAVNLGRMAQCMYQFGDGHGEPNKAETKNRVVSLLIEPISLKET